MLGFPCNQFAGQEPGSDAEILEFVTSEFDVNFPMFSKIEVNGDGAAALYKMLKEAQPGDGDSSDIAWNFGEEGPDYAKLGKQAAASRNWYS